MHTYLERVIQGFNRGQAWFVGRTELTAPNGTGLEPALSKQVTALGQAVVAIETAASDEDVAARETKGAAAEIRKAYAELRKELSVVASVSKVAIPEAVKITEALRVPRGRISHGRVLVVADAMAQEVVKYQAELVAAGLPAGFMEQLRLKAAALRAAINARGMAVAGRRGAAQRVKEAHAAGRLAFDTIGSLLGHHLSDDPALYAEWQQLRRVNRTGLGGGVVTAGSESVVPSAKPAV